MGSLQVGELVSGFPGWVGRLDSSSIGGWSNPQIPTHRGRAIGQMPKCQCPALDPFKRDNVGG